ncbi:unnamed protein product [Thelazia callipaeda]|uniref:Ileal sodium/bile acid cotransporter n=1 Tax=Thelazia callipaeda TaxID=103827 RepID=A0A0N5DA49_THECL|nr:unnamed protein product [Thelazia callipaeda]
MVNSGCPFLFLVRLLLNLMVSVASSGIRSIAQIRFDPPFIHDLIAGTNKTVKVAVDLDTYHQEFAKLSNEKSFSIILKSVDEDIATVAKKRKEFILGEYASKDNDLETYEGQYKLQLNVTLTGHFLGKTAIEAHVVDAEERGPGDLRFMDQMSEKQLVVSQSNALDVWVIRNSKSLENRVFLSTLVILIVFANVLMGCELDKDVVWQTIKKPVAPLIGFCTQFISMPLLAFAISNVVFMTKGLHSFALGVFVTGCVPGGGASNYWTLILDGNLPVSITMTFCSTIASLVMMPFWMWLLGAYILNSFHPEAVIKIPYIKIISSLVTIVLPLLFGVIISHFKPCLRHQARKIIRPFIIFVLVFLICFGALANLYMIRLLTWSAVLGGLLLPWCGFGIGCFTAIIFRQPPSSVTAIAIETGIQNTGIAIMLLKFSFPDPDADISALIPVISACMTPVPLFFIMVLHWIWKQWAKNDNRSNEDIEAKVTKICCNSDNCGANISDMFSKPRRCEGILLEDQNVKK